MIFVWRSKVMNKKLTSTGKFSSNPLIYNNKQLPTLTITSNI